MDMSTTQLLLEDRTSTQCSTYHKQSKKTKMDNQSCQDSEVICPIKQSHSTHQAETIPMSTQQSSSTTNQTMSIYRPSKDQNDLLATVLRNGLIRRTVQCGTTTLTLTCALNLEDRISMWLSKALRDLTELSRYYSTILTIKHSSKQSRQPETHTIILVAISDHNEYDHSPPCLSTFHATPGYFGYPINRPGNTTQRNTRRSRA